MCEAAKVAANWTAADGLPHSLSWVGPLPVSTCVYVTGCEPQVYVNKMFKYCDFVQQCDVDGQTMWHYSHCSEEFGVVIREIRGTMALSLEVRPLVNGKDRVTATTMGGNIAFQKDYGASTECRLFEFREECKAALMQADKLTKCTKIFFTRRCPFNTARLLPVRGNAVLKPQAVIPPKQRYRRPPENNRRIYEFFGERKNRKWQKVHVAWKR